MTRKISNVFHVSRPHPESLTIDDITKTSHYGKPVYFGSTNIFAKLCQSGKSLNRMVTLITSVACRSRTYQTLSARILKVSYISGKKPVKTESVADLDVPCKILVGSDISCKSLGPNRRKYLERCYNEVSTFFGCYANSESVFNYVFLEADAGFLTVRSVLPQVYC